MIDHINKIIFIHLEKTGGTSIESIFTNIPWWGRKNNFLKENNYDSGEEKHINLEYAKIIYKNEFKTYKKICIVRHPYSLFISKLNWYSYTGKINKKQINEMLLDNKTRWKINYLHEFLGEKDNYDFIIRFENYEEDYYKMLEKFNLDKNKFKLIHIHKEYDNDNYKSIYLTKIAKKKIKEYSKKYCEIFNYQL
jgi:hypothetical protein